MYKSTNFAPHKDMTKNETGYAERSVRREFNAVTAAAAAVITTMHTMAKAI